MSDLAVVIFAFNEAENIPGVLREVRDWLDANESDASIVLVDDGSTDGTYKAAASALEGTNHALVRHERNLGIGAALKAGVRATDAKWVTFLPADGQIPPEAIGILRNAARLDGADVVLSVYDHRDDGLDRKVLSWGVRALIRLVHGVNLKSDGPYLFRKDLFVPEELPPDTFFLNFEFPIRVLAQKRRVSTVTVPCLPRRAGHSKSTGLKRVAGVAKDLVDLRIRRFRSGL